MTFRNSTPRPFGLAILGTAMCVASCGSDETAPAGGEPATSDTSAATVELDDGWTLAQGEGYSVGLPPGWFDANRALDDDDFMAGLADEIQDDAELTELLRDETASVDLMAFQVSELTGDYPTNVNILTVERGPLDEPEVILGQAEDLVAKFGARLTGTDEYTVSGLPGVEISYDVTFDDVDIGGIQSYLFGDDTVYVATYTAVEPDPALWQSILETFSVA